MGKLDFGKYEGGFMPNKTRRLIDEWDDLSPKSLGQVRLNAVDRRRLFNEWVRSYNEQDIDEIIGNGYFDSKRYYIPTDEEKVSIENWKSWNAKELRKDKVIDSDEELDSFEGVEFVRKASFEERYSLWLEFIKVDESKGIFKDVLKGEYFLWELPFLIRRNKVLLRTEVFDDDILKAKLSIDKVYGNSWKILRVDKVEGSISVHLYGLERVKAEGLVKVLNLENDRIMFLARQIVEWDVN